ncbi:uncharacterized protein LOC132758629, partial [Ruditapes philippinarum]|uniref:uncharacterized protein LOC132758629 n=1 Tax=Ruditapes philippinarum TaxID=129788 RepID=UPI00295B1D67
MYILTTACFVVGFIEVGLGGMHIRSLSATQVHVDPCLASTLRNISHINERYAKLENNCLYTDRRIETAWFYAGVDPIVTFPPSLCRCGYKFPIWMNGTLPSPDDGVVNRTACIKFTQPCYRKLDIKIKNCGESYIYHLTPPGLDDSGYCFGIEKPEPPKAPDEHKLPNAIVSIQQKETTDNSVTCTVNITAIDDNYKATIELVNSDGLVIQTIVLNKKLMFYTWVDLSTATNYTIHVYVFNNGVKTEIASAWVVTKAPYRPARAHVDVLQNTITNSGFSSVITFDYGSDNKAGYGKLVQQDGVVILTFPVDNSSYNRTFKGLNVGTKYTIEVYINIHEEHIQLAHESIFTKPEIEVFIESKWDEEMIRNFTVFQCNFNHSPETTYRVAWFVQSKEGNHTIEKTAGVGEEIERLFATEKDLMNHHIALPFTIACKVFEIPQVIKEELSPASTSLFAGIKILTPTISMHRDETASIMISPTIPFGCTILQKTGIISCNLLTLAISIPVSKNCTGLSTRKCTITVPGNAGSISSLQIQATEDGQYGVQKDATHKVILRTNHVSDDSIWRDYTLPAVTVLVKPETSTYYRGKRCEALNDPHMYTFDGKRYEHHEHLSDEYVLYTHVSYTAKVNFLGLNSPKILLIAQKSFS